jgi:hypothetical protein
MRRVFQFRLRGVSWLFSIMFGLGAALVSLFNYNYYYSNAQGSFPWCGRHSQYDWDLISLVAALPRRLVVIVTYTALLCGLSFFQFGSGRCAGASLLPAHS